MSKYDRASDNLISVFNEYIFEHLEKTDFSSYIDSIQEWKADHTADHNSMTKDLHSSINYIRDKIGKTGKQYPGLIDWATTKPYLDTLQIAQASSLRGGGEKAIVTNIQIPYIQ